MQGVQTRPAKGQRQPSNPNLGQAAISHAAAGPAPTTQTRLAVCALGANEPGLIEAITRTVAECGCSVSDSRMTVLGDRFALMMLLSGSWDTIAKAENALPKLAGSRAIHLTLERARERDHTSGAMPYAVEVVTVDQVGVVHEITEFFAHRGINIEDLYSGTYNAAHTGTPMFSMHMTIAVPQHASVAQLRGEFMDFCDQMNIDAIIEPVK